jgi:hypothetical protein
MRACRWWVRVWRRTRTFAEVFCNAERETVLLFGPTGSGRPRLAEWIHSHSKRADKPFVRAVLADDPETAPGMAAAWPSEGCVYGGNGQRPRAPA